MAGRVALAACFLARTGLQVAGLDGVKETSAGLTHGGEGHGGRGGEEEQGEAHVDSGL